MTSEPVLFTLPGPWGIPIQVGSSIILLLVLFVALVGANDPVMGGIFFAVIVISILLHELGHAWACHVQGIRVDRVMIYGGGGFCQHSGRVTPQQDEFIVICGPLVNLALWALATLAAPYLFGAPPAPINVGGFEIMPPHTPSEAYRILMLFAQVNLFLAIFNMLPVLPLDGGRLLHAWLHRFMSGITASRVVGTVGVVMSILWIPAMFAAYFTFGFILLFFPPIGLHWRMMKGAQV